MFLAGPTEVRLLELTRFSMPGAGLAAIFFEGAVGAGVGILGTRQLGSVTT